MQSGKKFTWDAAKRVANIEKHGIAFENAIDVFFDPKAFTYQSPVTTEEERHVTIGQVSSRLVAVVYVKRDETYRIISARRARKGERTQYG